MSSLKSEITIQNELRPCWYRQERALFHCWEQLSQVIAPSPMVGGHPGGTESAVLAIIEFKDGSIAEVQPSEIMFCDNKHREYAFEESKKGVKGV